MTVRDFVRDSVVDPVDPTPGTDTPVDPVDPTPGTDTPVTPVDAPYSHTFASGDVKIGSNTLSNVVWTYSATGTYIGWDSNYGKGIQLGKSAECAGTATFTTTGIANFNTIIINASMANNGDSKLAVYVGDTLVQEVSLAMENAEYTFTLNAVSSDEIKIVYTNTTKAAYIKSIEVKNVEA